MTLIILRNDEDETIGRLRGERLDQVQAIAGSESQIEKDQIWIEAGGGTSSLGDGARFTTADEIILLAKQFSQPVPHQGMVINHQDAGSGQFFVYSERHRYVSNTKGAAHPAWG